MNLPDLPVFKIPELEPKKVSLRVVVEWNERNAAVFAKSGLRDRVRRDPHRVPVTVPFVL